MMIDKEARAAMNAQAAELAVIRLLLVAALRQIPDQRLLKKNFNEMAEDNEVRTMFSARPESFVQELQQHRAAWSKLLADQIAQTGREPPSDS